MNAMPERPEQPRIQAFAVQTVSGEAATLLTISADRPPFTAVAIVLDLSDSCASIRNELKKLPNLLSVLPRRWPLWVYRLSSTQPLMRGNDTVGDFCDGAANIDLLLDDREVLKVARETGSLIRPALEAIEKRRSDSNEISEVLALVITDGELFDAASMPPIAGLKIVGICQAADAGKLRNWNRILPKCRLLTLSDRALDESLKAGSYPFSGRCKINWTGKEAAEIGVLDPVQRRFRPSPNELSEVNITEDGALILVKAAHQSITGRSFQCTAIRTGESSLLVVPPITGVVTAERQQLVRDATAGSVADVREITVIRRGEQLFDVIAPMISIAAGLAMKNASWRDKAGNRIALADARLNDLFVNHVGRKYDAVLVLTDSNPRQAELPNCVVVTGMLRDDQPALRWTNSSSLPFPIPPDGVLIRYDRRERRWMIQISKECERELEPRGSELLDFLRASGADLWCAMFSGDLT